MEVTVYYHTDKFSRQGILAELIKNLNDLQKYFYFKIGENFGSDICRTALVSWGAFRDNYPVPANAYSIYITDKAFDDNWFSHEELQYSVISAADWDEFYAPPSLMVYLVYQIAQAVTNFVSQLNEETGMRLFHHNTTGCIFDLCTEKKDILLGMRSGSICPQCRSTLIRRGAAEHALEAVEKMTEYVRQITLGRITMPDSTNQAYENTDGYEDRRGRTTGNPFKPTRLFISHASQDQVYVSYFVDLLQSIGMTNKNMFCSSVQGYGIPVGDNIYDYLRQQFQDYELKVFFILSDNYYKSVASLNEMGAAWVLQHSYYSILLPHFEYRDIRGAIDPRNIALRLDSTDTEVKARLNDLYGVLKEDFGLQGLPYIRWEYFRDIFIEKIRKTVSIWNQLKLLEVRKRPADEWVLPLNQLVAMAPEGYDALYLLGIKYIETGNFENAIEYLERAERAATDEEMRSRANRMKQKVISG